MAACCMSRMERISCITSSTLTWGTPRNTKRQCVMRCELRRGYVEALASDADAMLYYAACGLQLKQRTATARNIFRKNTEAQERQQRGERGVPRGQVCHSNCNRQLWARMLTPARQGHQLNMRVFTCNSVYRPSQCSPTTASPVCGCRQCCSDGSSFTYLANSFPVLAASDGYSGLCCVPSGRISRMYAPRGKKTKLPNEAPAA